MPGYAEPSCVPKLTVTGRSYAVDRLTSKVTKPSASDATAYSLMLTCGELSRMDTPPHALEIVAYLGRWRRTLIVSSPSGCRSPWTGTRIDWRVSPGAKVSVPETAS